MPRVSAMLTATVLLAAIIVLYFHNREGFRNQEQKNALAARLIATAPKRPEFADIKAAGLDGAEFYELRQLWNNGKYNKANIVAVL